MANFKIIAHILGLLIGINGLFMLLSVPFCLWYQDGDLAAILISGGSSIVAGFAVWWSTRKFSRNIGKREAYMIVTFGWIIMALTGTLPYILSGTITDFSSAFFETLSGYTTTGASVLTDIESTSHGILFWRSMTHWIGGMGIIVLTIAILPILGIGGMQLFAAESPGPSADKLTPRIQETAKRLWLLYVGFTVLETILLMVGGMDFFDGINHALATVSTGGFSTKNASVAHFDQPYIQYVIILFMFLSGINFSLTYFGLKGKLKKVWKNEEFRYYLGVVLISTLVTTLAVMLHRGDGSFEQSFRDSLFQVVAVVTTTGFVSADFTTWGLMENGVYVVLPFTMTLFFLLMFAGGSAGSTSGGVKLVRHAIILKNSMLEFKRLVHPSAIVPVRLGGQAVTQQIVFNVMAFLLIYLVLFCIGAIVMASIGHDFLTSIGASASCIGNVGPGLGAVGPVENYAAIPAGGKLFLSFQMLVGRLELFTVLILLAPSFWRRN